MIPLNEPSNDTSTTNKHEPLQKTPDTDTKNNSCGHTSENCIVHSSPSNSCHPAEYLTPITSDHTQAKSSEVQTDNTYQSLIPPQAQQKTVSTQHNPHVALNTLNLCQHYYILVTCSRRYFETLCNMQVFPFFHRLFLILDASYYSENYGGFIAPCRAAPKFTYAGDRNEAWFLPLKWKRQLFNVIVMRLV